jgi:TonB family protein
MFETVAPEVRSKRVAYETLPISIALHAGFAAVAVTAAMWNVAFPTHSPKLMRTYIVASPDEPQLPAAPKPKADAAPQKVPLADQQRYNPNVLFAPAEIPDTIPLHFAERAPTLLAPAAGHAIEADELPGGADGGMIGGTAHGGTVGGLPLSEDGRLHFARDKALPLYVVNRPYPEYPEDERLGGRQATVVVRYVIGTDGWIKELSIIEHAKQKAFDDATLKALQQWRFRPLIVDGRAIEVVHELTVFYQLTFR